MLADRIMEIVNSKIKEQAPEPANALDSLRIGVASTITRVRSSIGLLEGSAVQEILDQVTDKIDTRIFDDGLDASMRQIGFYSEGYDKIRAEKGLATGRVILQFTGQMRQSMILQDSDEITIDFDDSFAENKSEWVESTYDLEIFTLSDDEEDFVEELIEQEANNILNGS